MSQEKANKIFETDFGQQLDVLYFTSDGKCFIRREEAIKHTLGKLDPNTEPLEDDKIEAYYHL